MSKAYEDQRNALVRRYLLQSLAKQKLNPTEHCIILAIIDETYGWKRDGQDDWRIRRDRVRISITELSELTECSTRSITRSLGRLVEKNIITQFESPRGSLAGVYGIQSDPSFWNKPLIDTCVMEKPPLIDTCVMESNGCLIDTCVMEREPLVDTCVMESKEPLIDTCVMENGQTCHGEGRHMCHGEQEEESSANTDKQRVRGLEKNAPNKSNISLNTTDAAEGEKTRGELAREAGWKMFKRIQDKYQPGGGSAVNRNRCEEFWLKYLEHHEAIMEIWHRLWSEKEDWEKKNGRRIYKPWKILDELESNLLLKIEQIEESKKPWRPRSYHYDAAYDEKTAS